MFTVQGPPIGEFTMFFTVPVITPVAPTYDVTSISKYCVGFEFKTTTALFPGM
jgi:hypothetical protein